MRESKWEALEGSPSPLGITRIEREGAYNFALYSRHATAVTLLLYADAAAPPARIALDPIKNKSGRVWHCRISQTTLADARYYAYSVSGEAGAFHRFDPDKVLLDPYAKAVYFPPGHDRASCARPGPTAGKAPLGVIAADPPPFDWGKAPKPWHTSDLVVYEMHVKGFTMRANSGVAADRRGTYLGVIDKIPYLKELGVTAIELLPVHQFDPREDNYWGYMTLCFFAPHAGYATGRDPVGAINEFRQMVKACREADIEVILDVVYNHTTEGGAAGPTYGFKGIDNSTYYLLDSNGGYQNQAGTGNVLRTAHPAVRALVADSLRHWAGEMGVDGFRFDLASIFTRRNDGSVDLEDPPIVSDISSDPVLQNVRLIAEAWDAAGAYHLGRDFPGTTWQQWNGRFRDEVRQFVKSDNGLVAAFLRRIYGSDDLFPDDRLNAYHPYQSVNFVTAHDGFCLYDLVSYNHKHNAESGGGSDDNRSWNCGWEGDENVPAAVLALRKRQIKNFCCALFLANGTPMFCAGDEFANTQRGNNNPYNQDNEVSWLDWARLEQNRDIFLFFKKMIAFRKAHPSLARSRYWRGDVSWYGVGRPVDFSEHSHTLAFCLHGEAEGDRDIYVMVNAYWESLAFGVHEGTAADWLRVIDTALSSPHDFVDAGSEPALQSTEYKVQARSVVVLLHR